MALINKVGDDTPRTKYSGVSLVSESSDDSPNDYLLRSAGGLGGDEVRLPHRTAGVERVTSDETPYGLIQVGSTWRPDPNNPRLMVPTPADPAKYIAAEEAARARRKRVRGEQPNADAALKELEATLAATAALADVPDEEPRINGASHPSPTFSGRPENCGTVIPPMPKQAPKIKVVIEGPHGKFRGMLLDLVEEEGEDHLICVVDDESGFVVPPCSDALLTIKVAGKKNYHANSTGLSFTYQNKLFVIFIKAKDE